MMQVWMPLAGKVHIQARSFGRERARREGARGVA